MDKKRRRLPAQQVAMIACALSSRDDDDVGQTAQESQKPLSSCKATGSACCRPLLAPINTSSEASDRLHSSSSASNLCLLRNQRADNAARFKHNISNIDNSSNNANKSQTMTTIMAKFKHSQAPAVVRRATRSSSRSSYSGGGQCRRFRPTPTATTKPLSLLLLLTLAASAFLLVSQSTRPLFVFAEEQAQVITGTSNGDQDPTAMASSAASADAKQANEQVSNGGENQQSTGDCDRGQQSARDAQQAGSSSSTVEQQTSVNAEPSKYSQPLNSATLTETPPPSTLSPTQQSLIDQSFEPQTHEDVPLVSGLVGQEEFQQQQQQSPTEAPQSTTDAPSNAAANGDSNNVQQELLPQQQHVDTDQQLTAAVGGIQTEPDSLTRLHGGAEMNEVNPTFGRKNANEQQPDDRRGQQQRALTASGKSRSVSNKRTHGGLFGVFGRKRSQAQASTAAAYKDEMQSFGDSAPSRADREYHYYYSIQHPSGSGASPTRSPASAASTTKSKLRNADFPDYREILVQPDQADARQQHPIQQQLFKTQRQPQPQQQVAVNQQRQLFDSGNQEQGVEQARVQVSEGDFSNEEQQQQQEAAATASDSAAEQSAAAAPGSSSSVGAPISNSNSAAPYIRLSNIATINSTGASNSNSSSGAGEMKLMRIYVIDLDQKLVVGNNQPGASSGNNLGEKIQYSLPDPIGSTSAAAAAQAPSVTQEQPVYTYSSPSASLGDTSQASRAKPAEQATAYASAGQTTTPISTLAPPAAQKYDSGDQQPAIDAQTIYEPQGQAVPYIPEGYVLLDRDSLQANLSQLFAQMQQQQQMQYALSNAARAANYSGSPMFMAPQMFAAPLNYSAAVAAAPMPLGYFPQAAAQTQPASGARQVVMSMPSPSSGYSSSPLVDQQQQAIGKSYTPLTPMMYEQQRRPPAIDYSAAAAGADSGAHLSGGSATADAYGATSVSYNASAPSAATQGYASAHKDGYQQQHDRSQPQQIAAIYPQPVSALQERPQKQQQQQQVYQSVPQYIAPQYKDIVNNPDNEYGWQQQAQSASGVHRQQQQHSSAPGQQVRYNTNYSDSNAAAADYYGHGNYSSKPAAGGQAQNLALFVQAPLVKQQQDKHHANNSDQYLSHQQEPSEYQQQPGLAAATYGEPGQHQYSEPAAATYKVTTAANSGSEHHWKPVDYSAPAPSTSYSQAAATSRQQQQSSISPAQYTNNRPAINGYSSNRDHDVVSPASVAGAGLASVSATRPQNYASAEPPGQQQEHRASNNYSSAPPSAALPASPSFDGQHAPLNYQPARKSSPYNNSSAGSQAAYVNTGQSEYQQQRQYQPPTGSVAAGGYDIGAGSTGQAAQASSYGGSPSANDAPSQQVPSLVGARAHPSLADYQYNGTRAANGGNSAEIEYQVQVGAKQAARAPVAVTNEYATTNQSRPKQSSNSTGSHTSAASSYGQVELNQQPSQYGIGSAAVYGQPGQQQYQATSSDQSQAGQTHEAPRIPHAQPGQSASGAGYKQTYNGQQRKHAAVSGNTTPTTAYLAVHGPPIADGVYESEEAATAAANSANAISGYQATLSSVEQPLAAQAKSRPARPPAKRPPRPVKGRPAKQAQRYKQQQQQAAEQQALVEQSADGGYYAPDQVEQLLSPAGEGSAAGGYQQQVYQASVGHQRPAPGGYMQGYSHGQRGFGGGGANGYSAGRPPLVSGGAKGLLSWETLSSVASGAAKRLPSLSSILMPFSGPAKMYHQHQQQYQMHQQQQQHPGAYGSAQSSTGYVKSAHYDRDVSAFHRPYPLRHMSHQGGPATPGYAAAAEQHSAPKRPAGELLHQSMEMISHSGEYDLSSAGSSSNESPSSSAVALDSGLDNGSSVISLDGALSSSSVVGTLSEHAEESSSGEQQQIVAGSGRETGVGEKQEPGQQQGARFAKGNVNKPQMVTSTANLTMAGGQEGAELAGVELSAVLAAGEQLKPSGGRPAGGSNNNKPSLTGRRPIGGGSSNKKPPHGPARPQVIGEESVSLLAEKGAEHQQSGAMDPAHAAVLSSIEHELVSTIDAGQPMKVGAPPPKTRRRPPKKHQAASFVDPAVAGALELEGKPFPLAPSDDSSSSSGADQAETAGDAGPALSAGAAGTASTPSAFGLSSLGLGSLRPPGSEGRPTLGSVQIGQYKITPQTQFVQSIIEPSRQMIGQYFKQYIGQLGQLGQLAGRGIH